jgi:hypothetical protein
LHLNEVPQTGGYILEACNARRGLLWSPMISELDHGYIKRNIAEIKCQISSMDMVYESMNMILDDSDVV